jgi:hypothetical protein
MPLGCEAEYVQMARREGSKKPAIAHAPHQSVATHFPFGRSISGARPPVRATDATARHRWILASASGSSRSPGARPCCPHGGAHGLDLAACRQVERRIASQLPNAAGSLSRTSAREGPRILLCVRTTGSSLSMRRRRRRRHPGRRLDGPLKRRRAKSELPCTQDAILHDACWRPTHRKLNQA